MEPGFAKTLRPKKNISETGPSSTYNGKIIFVRQWLMLIFINTELNSLIPFDLKWCFTRARVLNWTN